MAVPGEIFTTLQLPAFAGSDRCGGCRRCLDVCPTAAFPAPYQLDATRCVSYLTIEHKGHIEREFRTAIGNHLWLRWLLAVSWNKFARITPHGELKPYIHLTRPLLQDFVRLDDDRSSGIRRIACQKTGAGRVRPQRPDRGRNGEDPTWH